MKKVNLKIQLWYVVTSGGDGSSSALFFKDEAAAKAYADAYENSDGYEGPTDQPCHAEIEVDDQGNILNGEPPFSTEDF